VAVFLTVTIFTSGAVAAPAADGTFDAGEWDSYQWFTDSSEGPGTGYNDDPLPVFSGYAYSDLTNLYLAFDVTDSTENTNTDFLYVTFDIGTPGVFDSPVDCLYWGSIPTNASFYGEAYATADDFPWDRSQRSSTWGTDGGVVTGRSYLSGHRYYEMSLPLTSLGASVDDTIGLKVQARAGQYMSTTDPQVVNFYPDMPDGITPIRSDTRVEVPGNFKYIMLGEKGISEGQGPLVTPELPAGALLLVSLIPVAWAGTRRRRG